MYIAPHAPAGVGAAACEPASPLRACLDPCVLTPRSEERSRGLLASSGSRGSLEAAAGEWEAAAAATATGISALSDGGLQAVVRQLDACLPLADTLPLKQGEGYLVVRRRLPAPAPSPATGTAEAAAAAAVGCGTTAPTPVWTPADEARYQHSLLQLLQLVALREQAWPHIQAWHNRAAGRALGPGGRAAAAAESSPEGSSRQQLLHWAVMQRVRHMQKVQRQWQKLQALKRQLVAAGPAVPERQALAVQQEAAALQEPLVAHPAAAAAQPAAGKGEAPAPAGQAALEMEASFALVQLARGANTAMPPPAPRPPRHLQPPAAQPARSAGLAVHKPTAKHMPQSRWHGQQQGEPAAKRPCLAAPAAC